MQCNFSVGYISKIAKIAKMLILHLKQKVRLTTDYEILVLVKL